MFNMEMRQFEGLCEQMFNLETIQSEGLCEQMLIQGKTLSSHVRPETQGPEKEHKAGRLCVEEAR